MVEKYLPLGIFAVIVGIIIFVVVNKMNKGDGFQNQATNMVNAMQNPMGGPMGGPMDGPMGQFVPAPLM